MTNESANGHKIIFSENVWLSLWGIGILGLVLGVTAGVLTGVAIRNVVGDEPIISGPNASVFYVAFSTAVLLDIFLLFNFTNLAVRVTDAGLTLRYGMFSKSFSWDQITGVEATGYSWVRYGGWGIRSSTQGRRAWSQIGVKQGVMVDVTEGKSRRHYFVSSRRSGELAASLTEGIELHRKAISPMVAESGTAGS